MGSPARGARSPSRSPMNDRNGSEFCPPGSRDSNAGDRQQQDGRFEWTHSPEKPRDRQQVDGLPFGSGTVGSYNRSGSPRARSPDPRSGHGSGRSPTAVKDRREGDNGQRRSEVVGQSNGRGGYVVVDGPLRQPFADYMQHSEANAEFEGQDIGRSSLHQIPKDRRISFNDHNKVYSRLEAMKVAKEQALVREKAATYVKDGQDVPRELMVKYKKAINQKLGIHQRQRQRPPPQEAPPPAAMEAPPYATCWHTNPKFERRIS